MFPEKDKLKHILKRFAESQPSAQRRDMRHLEVGISSASQGWTQNSKLEILVWIWKSHSGQVTLVFCTMGLQGAMKVRALM